jgi:hypothetical protein
VGSRSRSVAVVEERAWRRRSSIGRSRT